MRHLFTHSAGWLGDYFEDTGRGDDALAKIVAKLVDLPQLTRLGTEWQYLNSGFYLAGRVIEAVTGKTYEAAMRELLFEPLGMTMSFLLPRDRDHAPARGRPLRSRRPPAHPAGGVISTVPDQLRYARFHLGDGTAPDGARLVARDALEASVSCVSAMGKVAAMKRLALALALALFISPLALASTAAAATTYTDSVRGVEIFPGVVIGNVRYGVSFVGQATSTGIPGTVALPGVVSTSINYSPPNPGAGVTNTVVSGKWALAVIKNGVFLGKLFGAVPGGTAVWNADGTVATVNLTLTITGGTGAFAGASGSGSFGGFLSHLTFPPRFGGTLTLTF